MLPWEVRNQMKPAPPLYQLFAALCQKLPNIPKVKLMVKPPPRPWYAPAKNSKRRFCRESENFRGRQEKVNKKCELGC